MSSAECGTIAGGTALLCSIAGVVGTPLAGIYCGAVAIYYSAWILTSFDSAVEVNGCNAIVWGLKPPAPYWSYINCEPTAPDTTRTNREVA